MLKKYLFAISAILLSFTFVHPAHATTQTIHKAAILRVNFPDNLVPTWSMQTAGNNLVDIANFYKENSYGNTIINSTTADVYGVYTITRGACDATSITAQASSA